MTFRGRIAYILVFHTYTQSAAVGCRRDLEENAPQELSIPPIRHRLPFATLERGTETDPLISQIGVQLSSVASSSSIGKQSGLN